MSVCPNLTNCKYKIEKELGRSREGEGIITWKGVDLTTNKSVVIKQFCFAQANSSWLGYQTYQKEIEVLQRLNYPYIPRYLDSIEIENGFCSIQEYIDANNCSDQDSLSATQVKQIAVRVLDILIYLQQQQPPIIHCNLKPENILLDESLNTYLIDFRFAGSENQMASSKLLKEASGFIAPEQIIQPTLASDIYSLGKILVYLLTTKNLAEINVLTLADDPYQLQLEQLLPDLEPEFLNWLKKMTNSKVSQRFPDALSARNALAQIDWSVSTSDSRSTEINPQAMELNKSKVIVGTLAIFSLTVVAVLIVNFTSNQIKPSVINLAIAMVATLAVGITQLGAASLAVWERQAKLLAIALGTVTPAVLVSTGGLIWGLKEAVIISTAIAISEIVVISYYWWQIPGWVGKIRKVSSWLVAVLGAIVLSQWLF